MFSFYDHDSTLFCSSLTFHPNPQKYIIILCEWIFIFLLLYSLYYILYCISLNISILFICHNYVRETIILSIS